MSEKTKEILKSAKLDVVVIEYIAAVLEGIIDLEEIQDIVTPFLLDSGKDESEIADICSMLGDVIICNVAVTDHDVKTLTNVLKIEETTLNPFPLSNNAVINTTRVDQKKLQKAEIKLAKKMEQRQAQGNGNHVIRKDLTAASQSEQVFDDQIDFLTSVKGRTTDIHCHNFDISFGGKRILTNSDLRLVFGRRYGLIGRNGIGKSTLLRAIARRDGLSIPKDISILHVEQEVVGDETMAIQSVLEEFLLRKEKSLLETQKTDFTVDVSVELQAVYARLEEIEASKAESRAASILYGLGFPPEQHSWPTKSFSGGWRMRIALARALFCRPDLLLLDEPTNMLDINAVIWLERYLATWSSTLLVVSHDRQFLENVATDIIHLRAESLEYYRGSFENFVATREEKRKNILKEYESQKQYRDHLQAFIDRWRYNANRAAQAQSKLKILEKLPPLEPPSADDLPVTFLFADPQDKLSPPILQLDSVSFRYTNDGPCILNDVNLDVRLDSRIALVGSNGAGKSTLGQVNRNNRLRIAHFTQHFVDQLPMGSSPVSYLKEGRSPTPTDEEVRGFLGRFGITGPLAIQAVGTLSGGQKSRVVFAKLAYGFPQIFVLDEPTNHLDMETIDGLINALKAFKGGVILVSHDERFIDATCNEMWVCEGGQVKKFRDGNIKEYKEMLIKKYDQFSKR